MGGKSTQKIRYSTFLYPLYIADPIVEKKKNRDYFFFFKLLTMAKNFMISTPTPLSASNVVK